jgi:hypothetical protein
MEFAANSMGMPVPNSLPEIEFISRCEVQERFYGYGAECEGNSSFVGAMFDPGTRTVSFSIEDSDLDTLRGKSFAVHELGHWVQYSAILDNNAAMIDLVNSKTCQEAAFEPPAYRAQFEYLYKHDLDPYATLPTNDALLILSSTCRPVYETERGEFDDYETGSTENTMN